MSNRAHHEALLRDVLAEESPDFLPGLREQTLRLARRRRCFRRARVVVLPCALVLGLAVLSWRWLAPSDGQLHSQIYALVRTRPMDPADMVRTEPLQKDTFVVSTKSSYLVTTAEAGYQTKLINDDELLELASPNSAVLVRLGPNQAELMLAASQ